MNIEQWLVLILLANVAGVVMVARMWPASQKKKMVL